MNFVDFRGLKSPGAVTSKLYISNSISHFLSCHNCHRYPHCAIWPYDNFQGQCKHFTLFEPNYRYKKGKGSRMAWLRPWRLTRHLAVCILSMFVELVKTCWDHHRRPTTTQNSQWSDLHENTLPHLHDLHPWHQPESISAHIHHGNLFPLCDPLYQCCRAQFKTKFSSDGGPTVSCNLFPIARPWSSTLLY